MFDDLDGDDEDIDYGKYRPLRIKDHKEPKKLKKERPLYYDWDD